MFCRKNIKARIIIPLLFFIISLLLCGKSTEAAESEVLSISLSDNARSASNSFTLSEIADIEGPREASRLAGSLRFSLSGSNVLSREEVIEALQNSGITGVRIELRMPSEVTVEVVGNPRQIVRISPEKGRDLAAEIKALSNWEFDVEVVPQGQIPPGELVGPASIIPGSASASLKFRDDRGRERSAPVRLTWYQPALILKRSIKRGEMISPEDIGIRSIKIMAPDIYASSPDQVVGKSLRKYLQQGEVILLSLLENMPIIKKGKVITLFISSGGMFIESQGEAMQDGSIGDIINVRNLSSKKIVSGIIRTSERVEVLNQ